MELRYYQTASGRRPFLEWLLGLRDRRARAKIEARLERVAVGNLGDIESVGAGILEMRVDWGPGYRVYFSRQAHVIVLLLCGGDKKAQQRDIKRAKTYLEDYETRVAKAKAGGPA